MMDGTVGHCRGLVAQVGLASMCSRRENFSVAKSGMRWPNGRKPTFSVDNLPYSHRLGRKDWLEIASKS